MGEGRYRTLLCLIQLAVPDWPPTPPSAIELLDPLEQDLDGAPLAAVLADPAVQIVVHAGRQDVALVRRRFAHGGAETCSTRRSRPASRGSARSARTTRCSRRSSACAWPRARASRAGTPRPLSPEQLAYAREDVVHLLELAAELERRLSALGRLEWAREECGFLERSATSATWTPCSRACRAIRGLSASAQTIARELVEWRERTAARQTGRCRASSATPRWSSSPSASRPRPGSWSRSAVSARPACTAGRASCSTPYTAAASAHPSRCPKTARPPAPEPEDGPLIALAEALLRARAREAGLAYELLAARADLQAIVAAQRVGDEEADVRTLRGWRRELVGSRAAGAARRPRVAVG